MAVEVKLNSPFKAEIMLHQQNNNIIKLIKDQENRDSISQWDKSLSFTLEFLGFYQLERLNCHHLITYAFHSLFIHDCGSSIYCVYFGNSEMTILVKG